MAGAGMPERHCQPAWKGAHTTLGLQGHSEKGAHRVSGVCRWEPVWRPSSLSRCFKSIGAHTWGFLWDLSLYSGLTMGVSSFAWVAGEVLVVGSRLYFGSDLRILRVFLMVPGAHTFE